LAGDIPASVLLIADFLIYNKTTNLWTLTKTDYPDESFI